MRAYSRRVALRLYRDVWITAAAVAMTVGMWAAFAVGTVPGVLGLFFSLAVLGVLIALLQQHDDKAPQHGRAVLCGAVGSAALVSTGGLVAAFGPEAFWLTVAGAASCPWLLRRVMRLVRRSTSAPPPAHGHRLREPFAPPEPPGQPELPPEPPVTTVEVTAPAVGADCLDDLALCLEWRRSFIALQRSSTLVTRMRVVQQRQLYLDELERRNADGLSAWLESGARAAGDPSRYIIIPSPSDQSGQPARGPEQSDR
jgi:hypothetical protein